MIAGEIALVGTSHPYQIHEKPGAAAFEEAVTSFLDCSSFMAIVEEMSSEALAEKSGTESVCERVAVRRSLHHLFCDPDWKTRNDLGIKQENAIRAENDFSVSPVSEEEIQRRVKASYDLREQYWLDRIFELDCWPVLLVCGADHVDTIAAKAKERGCSVSILIRDWEPET
jgi:hypothetical protein